MPSTCTPLSPRALKRSRYGGDALGRPSRASSCPRCDRPMALSARACCAGGAAAKAPTQRAARRNRRRMWCLGLRLDAQGGGGGGGGDRSYLCSTPSSSCDGVECVFAFPVGARAIGRVGARRAGTRSASIIFPYSLWMSSRTSCGLSYVLICILLYDTFRIHLGYNVS